MLDALGKGLSEIIRRLVTGVAIDRKAIEEILADLKRVLLEADVEVNLTEDLVKKIRKRCLEEKIPAGLTLREHALKVIYEELIRILGEKPSGLIGKKRIMFVGLFGSGKTTSVVKVARYLQKQGLRPAILALDYHRPAAIEQLIQLAKQINVPVYFDKDNDPYRGAEDGIEKFKNYDCILIDTAGRDALDRVLAEELKKLGEIIKPDEVLLTIPAEIGKVAGPQANEFNKLVGITGVFIARMDGTAKGGGALTSCYTTNAKVKFIGTGEKIGDLEVYEPERFVSRLLGLGDLQTLLEKAKEAEIKKEKVEEIVEGKLTLEDFYEQLKALQKMGPLQQLASLIPGFGMFKIPEGLLEKQEEKLKKFAVIIQSMTKEERNDPSIINASRIARIARGSGTSQTEVRELLTQYNQMKKLLRSMGGIKGLQRGKLKDLAKSLGFGF